jgi:hypothetical protein
MGAAEGVDALAPETVCTLSPLPNGDGWNSGSVTVTLTATDNSSGVHSITYSATGADPMDEVAVIGNTATFVIANEGSTTLSYKATDNSGNVEQTKTTIVKIDRSGPTVTASCNPCVLWPANGSMIPVTVTGHIVDAGAGIDPTSAHFAVTDEYGEIQPAGAVTVAPDGSYSFTVMLRASRAGGDKDGRIYTVAVTASDVVGNEATGTATVLVPHDRRK